MNEILAKSSGETLSEHTIECLKVAQSLIESLPLPEERRAKLRKDVIFAVAMHDVGKAAIGFQKVLRNEQKGWNGKRHEIISAAFAHGADLSPAVIIAILTHHRDIPYKISETSGILPFEQIPWSDDETPIWMEMAEEWKENYTKFQEVWKDICDYIGQNELVEYTELRPFSRPFYSWLNESKQHSAIIYKERYYASLLRGLVITCDHLGSSKIKPSAIPILRNYEILKNGSPRPFQKRIGNKDGSAILRAPTGSGKTEAALLWAQKNQTPNGRLFYVLPYTASINAMYRRLKIIFGENVGLVHHHATAALYSMLESDEDIVPRLDKQKTAAVLSELGREIYFPIRVCTPHQILRYTLRGKGWETMLAEFPKACFIFDEIHAYDPRVVGLTLASAKLLSQWGAKCLFLSATMPAFLHKLITDAMGGLPFIEPNPKQKEDKKILDKKRHNVEIKEGSIKDNLETIVQAIRNSSSTLIVCNHVKTSQEIYSIMKNKLQGEDIMLLHSRFNQEDRNRIENEIITNYPPKILVATQVVEVSLNVDFEQAFFEPAPIDALIQRMGRVNRYGSRAPAKVTIFTETVNPHHLYCECSTESHKNTCRVKLTIDELQQLMNPISEKDLVEAADWVYGEGYQGVDQTEFDEGFNHPDIKEFEARLLAGSHQEWVEKIIENTDGIFEVLPVSLVDVFNNKRKDGLWIEANSLIVPIRFRTLLGLQGLLDKNNDPWIINCEYSHEEGLILNKYIENIL